VPSTLAPPIGLGNVINARFWDFQMFGRPAIGHVLSFPDPRPVGKKLTRQ
jgi:hypothetical protein